MRREDITTAAKIIFWDTILTLLRYRSAIQNAIKCSIICVNFMISY